MIAFSLSSSKPTFLREILGDSQTLARGIVHLPGRLLSVLELGKVKEKIADLQNAQKAARQMYDAACQRLGIPNDLESDDT